MTTADSTATPGTLTVQIPGPAGLLPGWSVHLDGQPAPRDRPVPVRADGEAARTVGVEIRFVSRHATHRLDARLRADVPVPRGAAVRLQVPVESLLPVALAIAARRGGP